MQGHLHAAPVFFINEVEWERERERMCRSSDRRLKIAMQKRNAIENNIQLLYSS